MTNNTRVQFGLDNRIATLMLTGRNGTNAMDLKFVRELDVATEEVTRSVEEDEISVVVIRARGRHFCVGGDLSEFQTVENIGSHLTTMTAHSHRAMERLYNLTVPLVVGVHGAVAGAGLGLMLAGDVILATQTSTFRTAYAAAGLTPDAGVSWALPNRVGRRAALAWLLLNEPMDAEDMYQRGIATRIVRDEALGDELEDIVNTVAGLDLELLQQTKRLVASQTLLADHLNDEARTIARIAAT